VEARVKILVADDDLELAGLIGFALRQAAYVVIEAPDGPSAWESFERERPDLVILDVNMPRLTGFDVLRRIRSAGHTTPVMMLTVRSAEEDQVQALDLGADDYLVKPFSPRTLLARVRALLRRSGFERASVVRRGEVQLDVSSQSVRIGDGPPVRLTALEFRLLQLLLANAGTPLPAERLTYHVWGLKGRGDRQLLKQLVHRLRQKLETDPTRPSRLETVGGVGYVLHAAAESGGRAEDPG
jgi:DNA-binding response OmpR family regulator